MICSVALCNGFEMSDVPDTPHERLVFARERAGFSDKAAFAKAVGIHATTYRAYENGQNGFAKLAPTFAKRLGVTAEWLLHGDDGLARPHAPPAIVQTDHAMIRTAAHTDGAIALRKVDLSYAMGDGTNLEDYPEEEDVLFDPAFLRRISRAPAERLFVAKGDGD
jgi:transcriptional regulator with XRE-family HTH domain